jgi:hypothetical protein
VVEKFRKARASQLHLHKDTEDVSKHQDA